MNRQLNLNEALSNVALLGDTVILISASFANTFLMTVAGFTGSMNDHNLSVEIKYNNGNYSFIALNGNEYPSNENTDDESAFSFNYPTDQLIKGIDNTSSIMNSMP